MKITDTWNGASPILRELRKDSSVHNDWHLRWKPTCASTEKELTKWLEEKPFLGENPRAIIAARQSKGHGQRGKIWHSPIGGVWMSIASPVKVEKTSSGLLGLSFALSLTKIFEKFGVGVKIKWPNDLLIGHKKLAGFLPSFVYRGDQIRYGRLGIGLNVCNVAPVEGISISKILRPSLCKPSFWAKECIVAFESALDFLDEPDYLCREANKRIWSSEMYDINDKEIWLIEGFQKDGSIKLKKGSEYKKISRWP